MAQNSNRRAAREITQVKSALPAANRFQHLAGYACHPEHSRGRLYAEPECPMRTPFQRDRDRIVHSSAFRRLTHKTQVFIYHEGDHYRSRLTHTIEVAQIARTIARQLALDEDLAESVALAHDLGHPPFGHAGERALADEMSAFGGFDHNAQSLEVVTKLERKYLAFDGLNLSWETLEGIVKHNGPLRTAGRQDPLPQSIENYDAVHALSLDTFASLEAQAAAIADDIAYNNHDLDDGLRAGLLDIEMLHDVPLISRFLREVEVAHCGDAGARAIYEVNRRLITAMVFDVVDEARRRIAEFDVSDIGDVRSAPTPIVSCSARMSEAIGELRAFLFSGVYRNARVMAIMGDAEQIVRDLFRRYLTEPSTLPEAWAGVAATADERERARLICDYVAGMTDRLAIQEHRRLFDVTPELR